MSQPARGSPAHAGAGPPPLRWPRVVYALAVSLAFLGVTTTNLCYPVPLGPADQGDFARLAGAFSSGPKDLPFFPEPTDPSFGRRFSKFYHRLWRRDGGMEHWAKPSSSHLVYLPGRLLPVTSERYFDLTLNTLLVLVLLACAFFATLLRLRTIALTVALSFFAFIASDAHVSLYLNSFYQESGAYVATVLLVCALALLVERPRHGYLLLIYVCLALLATTKFAFAPAALVLGLGVALALLLDGASARDLRVVSTLLLGALVLCAALYFESSREQHSRENAYNFLFSTALPALPSEERGRFLAEAGIAPSYARLSGTHAYAASLASEREELSATLDNAVHARAILELARSHPSALIAILRKGLRETGKYDIQALGGYGVRPEGFAATIPSRHPWSDVRSWILSGQSGFLLAALLFALLLVLAASARAGVRLTPSGFAPTYRRAIVLSLAAMIAAASQVALAILGNGRVDIHKHLYLGNLLNDVGFVFGVAVLGLASSRGGLYRPFARRTRRTPLDDTSRSSAVAADEVDVDQGAPAPVHTRETPVTSPADRGPGMAGADGDAAAPLGSAVGRLKRLLTH